MKKKRSSFGTAMLRGGIIFNPVLIQLAGICPVAAVSTDLPTSLLFSVVFTVITAANCLVASALLKKVPRWIRVTVYMVLGLCLSCLTLFAAEEAGLMLSAKVYMYLPLLAVNSVTAVHCEQYSVKHTVPDSLQDALAVSFGFGAIFLLLGALREMIGSGTLGGWVLPVTVTLRGVLMPFGSFILLGYLAMILKWYINKYRPEFNEETAVTIKHKRVRLRGEKEEDAESLAAYSEEQQEFAFLFGSEPEEVEFFTEFWAPAPVTTESIRSDIDTLNEQHRQYSESTELRIEDLFKEFDARMAGLNREPEAADDEKANDTADSGKVTAEESPAENANTKTADPAAEDGTPAEEGEQNE